MNRRIAIISDNSIEYVKKVIEIWNNGDSVILMDWRIPFPTIIKNIMQNFVILKKSLQVKYLNIRKLSLKL